MDFPATSTAVEEDRACMRAFTFMTRTQWILGHRRREGTCGTTVPTVPGIIGDRHELALAANSGAMIDDCADI
eukprot:1883061-Pyramimonas_sp.AAC.1